jgi:hypothetical protein
LVCGSRNAERGVVVPAAAGDGLRWVILLSNQWVRHSGARNKIRGDDLSKIRLGPIVIGKAIEMVSSPWFKWLIFGKANSAAGYATLGRSW